MQVTEERNDNLFPTVTPTIIEGVEIIPPPEIERLVEVFKSDALKDVQHEIQTPGKPNRSKVGKRIADMTAKARQDLKKKGVLQVTGRKLYVTGGVVRDWLINHFHGMAYPPDDWDLATDASVESFKLIIKVAIETKQLPEDTQISTTNKQFGNIQLTISGKTYDVTTFPFAGYADAPRMYLDSLRRNFNVNALYYSPDEKKIYDYHTGIADIYRRSPQFVGKAKKKLKDDQSALYPLIYARLHARMNSKGSEAIDKDVSNEIRKFALPKDVNRADIRDELHKGVKQAIDKGKYFKILNDMGVLKQILPNIKVNPNAPMGEMTLFPQVLAQVLHANWNNMGHMAQVLHSLEFNNSEIHDIMFLMKLSHYQDEAALKADRLHTGLSDRAVEQYIKVNSLKNSEWIMAVLKNGKRPLKPQPQVPQPQEKKDVPPVLQVAHTIIEGNKNEHQEDKGFRFRFHTS